MTFSSLRIRISILLLVLAGTLCVLMAYSILVSIDATKSVELNQFRNQITREVNSFAVARARERGTGNTLIGGNKKLMEEFVSNWADSNEPFDRIVQFVLTMQERKLSTIDIDRKYENWRNINRIHRQARERLIKGELTSDEWLKSSNASILAAFETRNSFSLPVDDKEAVAHYNTILIPNIATLSEFAGRERAILGNAIASGSVVSQKQQALLDSYRSLVERSAHQILLLKENTTTTPDLRSAIGNFEKVFLQDFEIQRQAVYKAISDTEQDINDVGKELEDISEDILFHINGVADELDALLSNSELLKEVAAAANGEEAEFSRVNGVFEVLSDIHHEYGQIRYLDADGKERVRLDYAGGENQFVGEDQLQDKSKRPYYVESKGLAANQIYLSPLDLNIENGSIERPFKPMLRYAKPALVNGRPLGVVVLNVLADRFLEKLDDDVWLVDQHGYYLHHSDPSREWGMMPELNRQQFNLNENYPELAKFGASGKQGVVFPKGETFVIQPVYFHPGDPSQFWLLIKKMKPTLFPINSETWIVQATEAINASIAISNTVGDLATSTLVDVEASARFSMIVSLVFGALVAFLLFFGLKDLLFVRRMMGVILAALGRLGSGDLSHRIVVDMNNDGTLKSDNEMTAIAMGINAMTGSLDESVQALRDAKADLETRVKSRTRDLEEEIQVRKETEREIRKLSLAVEQSPSSVVITDIDGAIEYVNPSFSNVTGYTLSEIAGKTANVLNSEKIAPQTSDEIWSRLKSGREWRGELINKRKNGEEYAELAVVSPLMDTADQATHYVAVTEDISERKVTEEALRRTQKLDAIGELSGGLAHDFNNLLGIIIGNLDLVKRRLQDDDKSGKNIGKAYNAALRGSELTRRLLNFSRQSTRAHSPIDINRIINGLDDIVGSSLTSRVSVEMFLSDDLWLVELDPGDFEDAIVNLALNARDAMPKGGRLILETKNAVLDRSVTDGLNELEPGDFVEFTISDTGVGMSREITDKVFDPFFTTKETDKGTGLGLAMVYGFVQRTKGHVSVYSEEGVGTTFRFFLPRSMSATERAVARNKFDEVMPRGSETILIVDDEQDLAAVAESVLADLGYTTICAYDGEEALAILKENRSIDMLFSDIVMPGAISGFDLAEAATKLSPEMKILLTSGFTGKMQVSGASEKFANTLLNKPYRGFELARRVRNTLDETS